MDTRKRATRPPTPAAPGALSGGAPEAGDPICPVTQALEIVASKWSVHILFALRGGTLRFRELQRAVGSITQKELTKQLRRLERFGLVDRRVYAEVPPRVEYQLTDIGVTLGGPLEALSDWAKEYGRRLEERRRRYDQRAAKKLQAAG